MNKLKISSRLYVTIAISALVMIVLLGINWIGLTKLADLQDESYRRTQDAGQLRQDSGLAAQAYRIIADSAINRQLDESVKKWETMRVQIEKALIHAEKVADTADEHQWAKDSRKTADEIDKIFTSQFLVLVKADAPLADIASLDDQIDKLIDQFDESFSKLAASTQVEAQKADESFDSTANTTRIESLISIAVGALLMLGVSLYVSRSITGQLGMELSEATEVMKQIANGNLAQDIPIRSNVLDSLAANLSEMQKTLQATVQSVRSGSENVSNASTEIAVGNNDLSARTEEQASALEQTAASMEQLSASVKLNAENASQANQLANTATAVAVKGGEVVSQVIDTMKGINESSKQIEDIISVVDGIAFQTNILALNAAVEAARAGEQGRGFAVVASEVRSLAGRSADAAKQIKALIVASVDRVEQGTALVGQAGVTMTEVVNSVRRVTDLMSEISAASNEQSIGVSQVGEAVMQMDQVTQQNAALVEEMAAAAESLKAQANDLVQSVCAFTLTNTAPSKKSLANAKSAPPRKALSAPTAPHRPAFKHMAGLPKSMPFAAKAAVAGDADWENF